MTIGVAAEALLGGAIFVGPRGKTAWSPQGHLSSALGCVVGWDVTAHPSDPWPLDRSTVAHALWSRPARPRAARPAQRKRAHAR